MHTRSSRVARAALEERVGILAGREPRGTQPANLAWNRRVESSATSDLRGADRAVGWRETGASRGVGLQGVSRAKSIAGAHEVPRQGWLVHGPEARNAPGAGRGLDYDAAGNALPTDVNVLLAAVPIF